MYHSSNPVASKMQPTFAVSRQQPLDLSVEEVADPFVVLKSFFTDYDLESVSRMLSSWFASIYKHEIWKEATPYDLCYFYKRIIKVLEAVWIISSQRGCSSRAANLSASLDPANIQISETALYCIPNHRDRAWDHFPRVLSREEFVNPYLVIFDLFKFRNLGEWRQELDDLLGMALSDYDLDQVVDAVNIKESIGKMVDAVYIICVREFKWPGQLED